MLLLMTVQMIQCIVFRQWIRGSTLKPCQQVLLFFPQLQKRQYLPLIPQITPFSSFLTQHLREKNCRMMPISIFQRISVSISRMKSTSCTGAPVGMRRQLSRNSPPHDRLA
ncbi:hypothetical protein I7I50_06062 [Histoplasma capsulatum G186AR]|uniref:Uncharacterized protein n=1 Tax=Ajellomyces capsulatus TaxID=5037 RepID=A0A8H7Z034_AJECA|nr:hypothetical protein I7I52_08800 [Histoplasma capsulatum]QSS67081.1 hypothetical protein I7I50_06062 [Histoplasma capsulatum G186AR]